MIEKLFKAKKIDYTILIKTINHILHSNMIRKMRMRN